MVTAYWGFSPQVDFSPAIFSIMALNFVISFFNLRLGRRAPIHWGYRVLVSAVVAVTAPAVATAIMVFVAALIFALALPGV